MKTETKILGAAGVALVWWWCWAVINDRLPQSAQPVQSVPEPDPALYLPMELLPSNWDKLTCNQRKSYLRAQYIAHGKTTGVRFVSGLYETVAEMDANGSYIVGCD